MCALLFCSTCWQWATFAASIPASIGAWNDSDKAVNMLLSEAPQAWQEYQRRALSLSGTFTMSYTVREETQTRRGKLSNEFLCNSRCNLLILGHEEGTQTDNMSRGYDVYGFNPRYSFELRSSSRQGPWVLTQVSPSKTRTYEDKDLRQFLVMLPWFTLSEALTSPKSEIRRCTLFSKQNQREVEVAFRFSGSHVDVPIVMEGTCVLMPDDFWVLKSYAVQIHVSHKSGEVVVHDDSFDVLRYHRTKNEILTPAAGKRRTSTTRANQTSVSENIVESELDFLSQAPPDDSFTLSAFGLPEPPGVTWERPTPWWLYGIVVGFALVILSGIVYKVVGRWRTQAAKPQPR